MEEDSFGPDRLLDNIVRKKDMSFTIVGGQPHISTLLHFWKPENQWSTMVLIKTTLDQLNSFFQGVKW